MTLTPRLRKAGFLAHVLFSVGWTGAVLAYLALAVGGLRTRDHPLARSAYLSMELIGWTVIVPLSLASLASGVVQSLGTEWGLFRHYWVSAKFLIASVGSVVLLVHMRAVGQMAGFARATLLSADDFGHLRISLVVHAAGGLLVLVAATWLSIYKPWGVTPYGRRALVKKPFPVDGVGGQNSPRARRGLYVAVWIAGITLLLLLLHHLAGGGLRHH